MRYLIILLIPFLMGTTYYVRTDGGTATQCTGQADAAYDGDGEGEACAFAHPYCAIPPGGGAVQISTSDTLIIKNGTYMMGYGSPCSVTDSCYVEAAYDCGMQAIPDGVQGSPTRILGEEWDSGCSTKPKMWGQSRLAHILSLNDSDYVEVQCLEFTDGDDVVNSGGVHPDKSNRDAPYDERDFADRGIYAADSQNVLLKNLYIHGMENQGIQSGRLKDWALTNVELLGNGFVGWDGDIDGSDYNTGKFTLTNVTIAWSGCVEAFPIGTPIVYDNCFSQSQGGYGDGVGMGLTSGDWYIIDSDISHNASDGLDLLYMDGTGSVTIQRSRFEGNAGNQVKTADDTIIENSKIVSNCGYFHDSGLDCNIEDCTDASFDDCRSLGNAIEYNLNVKGQSLQIYNSTVWSEGDCLITAGENEEAGDHCDGTEVFKVDNTIFNGADEFLAADTSCFYFCSGKTGNGDGICCSAGPTQITTDVDYSFVYNVKNDDCPSGTNNTCEVDPLFTEGGGTGLTSGVNSDDYDLTLTANSTCKDAADTTVSVIDSNDFNNTARGVLWDIGAFESASTTVYHNIKNMIWTNIQLR